MHSLPNAILIINFDFPPNQGIGGRRWGKLAKGLARQGVQVFVIKANPVKNNMDSPWTNDVKHPNIHVVSLPRTYPEAFSHPKDTLIGKLKYRWNKLMLLQKEAGTIYDISIGWDKYLIPAATKLIEEHNIQYVCATGAPWNLLVYSCKLKETFPALHITVDYRDPWLTAKNYGMSQLSKERKSAEVEKQNYVLQHANLVLSPAKFMTEEVQKEAPPSTTASFSVLPHFYDEDDTSDTNSLTSNDRIILLYGGDLYQGVEPQLRQLISAVEYIKEHNPILYKKIQIRIFTNSTPPEFLKNQEAIQIMPSVGKQIFQELRTAHYCLILLPENKKNHITTKSIEYLPFKKPFLAFTDQGDFTEFIHQNKVGYHIVSSEQLNDLLTTEHKELFVEVDITKYSLTSAATNLLDMLK